MFVPPLHLIEKHTKSLRATHEDADQVVIHAELFHFLLRCALEHCEFDEAQYQRCNPDVADAVDRREFENGREHFLTKGYLEGRVGAVPVHEAWYLSHNPDVEVAKQAGLIESAEAHYRGIGAVEWREPNPEVASIVRAWKRLMTCLRATECADSSISI